MSRRDALKPSTHRHARYKTTCFQFNGRSVGSEYIQLVLVVALKMIIDGRSANGAAHACSSILSPEHDDSSIGIIFLIMLRKSQIVPFKRPLNPLPRM